MLYRVQSNERLSQTNTARERAHTKLQKFTAQNTNYTTNERSENKTTSARALSRASHNVLAEEEEEKQHQKNTQRNKINSAHSLHTAIGKNNHGEKF